MYTTAAHFRRYYGPCHSRPGTVLGATRLAEDLRAQQQLSAYRCFYTKAVMSAAQRASPRRTLRAARARPLQHCGVYGPESERGPTRETFIFTAPLCATLRGYNSCLRYYLFSLKRLPAGGARTSLSSTSARRRLGGTGSIGDLPCQSRSLYSAPKARATEMLLQQWYNGRLYLFDFFAQVLQRRAPPLRRQIAVLACFRVCRASADIYCLVKFCH